MVKQMTETKQRKKEMKCERNKKEFLTQPKT